MDVDGLEFGVDFVETINQQLQGCQVLLALIGPNWLTAKDRSGNRRIDNENDFVRIEIKTALEREVRVIPVLIDGTAMPTSDDLPINLKGIVRRQALKLDFDRFDQDINKLTAIIRKILDNVLSAPNPLNIKESTGFIEQKTNIQIKTKNKFHVYAILATLATTTSAGIFYYNQKINKNPLAEISKQLPPSAGIAASKPATAQTIEQQQPKTQPSVSQISTSTPQNAKINHEKRIRDCESDSCPWLIKIPTGKFLMGSLTMEAGRNNDEEPQHEVIINYSLLVMETEITRSQFEDFIKETKYQQEGGCNYWTGSGWKLHQDGSWNNPGFPQLDTHPVVCINWNDAKSYAEWLSNKTKKSYRLLTESEWEYAARSGNQTRFSFGENQNDICRFANTNKLSSCDDNFINTSPVKSYKPNSYGLYDMHGNVWEWVEDCWHDNYTKSPINGEPWLKDCKDNRRVLRGGSWHTDPKLARSASRLKNLPNIRINVVGFRLARIGD